MCAQMVVFDTRLFDLAERLQHVPVMHNSVPLPLLHRDQPAPHLRAPKMRRFHVSFSGDCTNPMRSSIARWLKDVPRARVHACGRKIAVHQWWQEVANSNFTVAPSGTFPPTFMLYEAMLLGSIPVLVFSAAEYTLWGRDTTISREHLSDDDIDRLMPYYVRAQSNTARSTSVYLLPRPRARRTKASASLGQASSSRKRQVRTSRGLLRRPWPPFPAV